MTATNIITETRDAYTGAVAFYLNGRLVWGSEGDVTMDTNDDANAFWVYLLEVLLAEKEFSGFTLETINCIRPLDEPSIFDESRFEIWPMRLADLPPDPYGTYDPDNGMDIALEVPF